MMHDMIIRINVVQRVQRGRKCCSGKLIVAVATTIWEVHAECAMIRAVPGVINSAHYMVRSEVLRDA